MRHTSTAVAPTRTRILNTALDLFCARGYEKTSMRDVAEDVGVTKAAVYYHFAAKEEILLDLFSTALDELEAGIDALARTGPSPERGENVLAFYLDFLIDHERLMRLLVSDLSILAHPDVGDRLKGEIQRMIDLLAGPRAGRKARARSACAIGALQIPIALYVTEDLAGLRDTVLEAAVAAWRSGG